jgi:orotate phosphoribosyltransferase
MTEPRRRHRIVLFGGGGLELLRVLQAAYEFAYVDTTRIPFIAKPNAKKTSWALDMREALSRSDILRPVAEAIFTHVLQPRGCDQIVGYGYGSFPLLGAIAAAGTGVKLGMLRPAVKADGFGRLLEGSLDIASPVVVVDDLINSGKTVRRTVETMSSAGYEIAAATCVFQFGWGKAQRLPRQTGLDIVPLATLNKRSGSSAPGLSSQQPVGADRQVELGGGGGGVGGVGGGSSITKMGSPPRTGPIGPNGGGSASSDGSSS